ncbi:hypothetical protein BDQ12DRAFT_415055 [Crucibulum laeve]|uniref:Copper-fist domain-containing protein n=1 Tax=Crucibulum laeve TaxID=68775 RepID=A0A5C3MAW1_9AGAR|nr:hypothetical protein BDQ12DRAFT_415055 [Crucibulum laeve]
MVYVNSQKFACESCIKGHRSSSCHHTDRPLFEIKKKGRPVSQCEKCRELRQSKRVHSKCTCSTKATADVRLPSGSKSRRFIPIVPALPNGLKDVLGQSQASTSTLPPDSRQRVDSLLNPCKCKSVWKCRCATFTASGALPPPDPTPNLATLAQAASLRCCETPTNVVSLTPSSNSKPRQIRPSKRQTSRPGSPNNEAQKRLKSSSNSNSPSSLPGRSPAFTPGPDLAPILFSEPSYDSFSFSVPTFELMPPMSTITSLAGSGCTCGVLCACPGCAEHRGSEHTESEVPAPKLKNCADGCGQCVDPNLLVLPSSSASYTSPIDMFFATMAAIPPPPTIHRSGNGLRFDPLDITVRSKAGTSFSRVNLPKLECCGGRCACPNGHCSCGKSCSGRCGDDAHSSASSAVSVETQTEPPRSCCAGKAVVRAS